MATTEPPSTTTVQDILTTEPVGSQVILRGWIKSLRSQARVAFVHLHDGSTPPGRFLQLVLLAKTHPSIKQVLTDGRLDVGLEVVGEVVPSKGAGQAVEVFVKEVTHFGPRSEEPYKERVYPTAVSSVGATTLRRWPHMRPRTDGQQLAATVRHKCMMETHRFFDDRGFRWIATPVITGSDCEGAGEQFAIRDDPAKPFFKGCAPFLTVSGQVDLEPFYVLGKVYTFGPTFRAEHSDTSRHLAEFWMVEPEILGSLEEVMDLAEAYVKTLLAIPAKWSDQGIPPCPIDLAKPFVRITYTEAVFLLIAAEWEVAWGDDLGSKMEMWLTEHLGGPVFVTHYPADLKAFYMRQTRRHKGVTEGTDEGTCEGTPKTVEAFDLLLPGIGEVIGGSAREEDEERLMAAMTAKGMDTEPYQAYLDLRHWGSLPHGGFGLGFERMVCYVGGFPHIREVVPYIRAYDTPI